MIEKCEKRGRDGPIKKRSDSFTFEDHQRMAAKIVAMLEELNALSDMLSDGDNWTASRKTIALLLKTGRAIKGIQWHLETRLALQDLNDLRSYELYYPVGKPETRGSWGA